MSFLSEVVNELSKTTMKGQTQHTFKRVKLVHKLHSNSVYYNCYFNEHHIKSECLIIYLNLLVLQAPKPVGSCNKFGMLL